MIDRATAHKYFQNSSCHEINLLSLVQILALLTAALDDRKRKVRQLSAKVRHMIIKA